MDRTGHRAWLALGSNMGDRLEHLRFAVGELRAAGRVERVSSVYETDPVGYRDQPPFLNAVLRLSTELSPRALLESIQRIETDRGRVRPFADAPRSLDVDLLLYDDQVIRERELEVPHPRMHTRLFVLVPLLEIEPGARDPRTGTLYADHLGALDPSGATRGVVRMAPTLSLEER